MVIESSVGVVVGKGKVVDCAVSQAGEEQVRQGEEKDTIDRETCARSISLGLVKPCRSILD